MKKLGIVMDPIATIHPHKDTSLRLLLEAISREYQLYYMLATDLFIAENKAYAEASVLEVYDNDTAWYSLDTPEQLSLATLDVILMRKDPPFNMDYIYATYILQYAQIDGVLVINDPAALRDANEKMFILNFPACIPPTLVASRDDHLRKFIQQQQHVVLKPLDGMGGMSIYTVKANDDNITVILQTLTHFGQTPIMAQQYIPEIKQGDKRILLINGEPVPYALARIPASGESRGNLAAGGKGVSRNLTERDYWICQQLAPVLKQKGLLFVGIDVIGDYLTEINVTSPTCLRELEAANKINIAAGLFDAIESYQLR